MSDEKSILSVQGQQRRDEILALVLDESRRFQRQRKQRRTFAGMSAMVLLLASVVWGFWPPAEPDSGRPRVTIADGRDGATLPTTFDLARYIVRTEAYDLDRYLVRTSEEIPPGVVLSDMQLLSMLANIGRSEGIIRAGQRTWLTSQLTSQLAARN